MAALGKCQSFARTGVHLCIAQRGIDQARYADPCCAVGVGNFGRYREDASGGGVENDFGLGEAGEVAARFDGAIAGAMLLAAAPDQLEAIGGARSRLNGAFWRRHQYLAVSVPPMPTMVGDWKL